MKDQIDLYVPVRVGKILCHSKLLDDIGAFTKYMIWAIGKGYAEDQIEDTVQLDKSVVEEAGKELERWKFAKPEYDGQWKLTDTGKKYFELICCMEKLEGQDSCLDCCVELYRGGIELIEKPIQTIDKDDLPQGAIQLNNKVAGFFLRNDDYENSLELAKQKLQEKHLLEEEYMDSLYTTLSLGKKTFRRYRTPSYDLEAPDCSEEENDIQVAVPITHFRYRRYWRALDEYRTILETLKNLRIFEQQRHLPDGTILSETARDILESFEEEQKEPAIDIYMDDHAGKRIWETPVESAEILKREETENLLPCTGYEKTFREESGWRYELQISDETCACIVKFRFEDLHPAEEEIRE